MTQKLALVLFALFVMASPQQPETGEAYVRERASGEDSLLLSMFVNAGKVSEVQAELPSDRKLAAAWLPDGWSVQQKGKTLRAAGPPVAEVNLRFDLPRGRGKDYAGKRLALSAVGGGVRTEASTLQVGQLDRVETTPHLEGILSLTPEATPGEAMLVGIAEPYRRGQWHFVVEGGAEIPIIPVTDLAQDERLAKLPRALAALAGRADLATVMSRPEPRPWITVVPQGAQVTGVRFTDRWGERLVDGPIAITSVPRQATACPLGVTGGSEFAFAGQAACVKGCFPDLASAYSLTLDGAEVTPWGVSQSTVLIGVPTDAAAGRHEIQAAGGGGRATVDILQLQGSIDQNELWRGQGTTMRLRIIGTERPVPLIVLNRTPGVIAVEGGVHQTVHTSGGVDNVLTRAVKGIHRGNFHVTYSLDLPGCGQPR